MVPMVILGTEGYGLLIFLLVTGVLGGMAAFVTGRAIAGTWRPIWLVPTYLAPLAFAVRFIHFSVFGDTLFSLQAYLIDYAFLLVVALAGFLLMRREQMAVQYGWRDATGA